MQDKNNILENSCGALFARIGILFLLVINILASFSDSYADPLDVKSFYVKVQGTVQKLNNDSELNKFFIAFPTDEGLHRFEFEKVDSKKYLYSQDNELKASFFKGKQLRKSLIKNTNAAADIEDGILNIYFLGRRSGKSYRLSIDLKTNENTGRITHFSSFFGIDCAAVNDSPTEPGINNSSFGPRILLNREITLSVDADYNFLKNFKQFKKQSRRVLSIRGTRKNASNGIRSIINTVNSIYSEQLGIRIILVDIATDVNNERTSQSTDSETVLEHFRSYAKSHRYLKKANINHLFTGNRLRGSVVGLAYVGSTCRTDFPNYAYGLSRYTNPAVQALVTAHEIAHNLGATHVEGDNSIMSPVLTGNNNTFIDFSFAQIENYISEYGTCLNSTVLTK